MSVLPFKSLYLSNALPVIVRFTTTVLVLVSVLVAVIILAIMYILTNNWHSHSSDSRTSYTAKEFQRM